MVAGLAGAIALDATIPLAAGWLATGSAPRRALAFGVALSSTAVPFLIDASHATTRAALSVLALGIVLRNFDLVVRREPTSALQRVLHAGSAVDSFHLRRSPPAFDARSATRLIAFACVMYAGYAIAFDAARRVASHPASLAVRWLGGLVFVYALLEVVGSLFLFLHRAVGLVPPPLHRDPLLARSVREFWGKRWNRIVSTWLDARVARPLARRGMPRRGMALAFAVSAALHWYVTWPALGVGWSTLVLAFFLAQGAIALAEGPLAVATWPRWAGHLWTVGTLVLTSPLFVEPLVRVVSP